MNHIADAIPTTLLVLLAAWGLVCLGMGLVTISLGLLLARRRDAAQERWEGRYRLVGDAERRATENGGTRVPAGLS